ncbi:hypothetical protein KFE98_14875 [bacterium SCSIO 12741]|nr:hypothetical protein KFE98_14875 [bacterium SCSIO 12741]
MKVALILGLIIYTIPCLSQCDHLPWKPQMDMNNWKAEFQDLEWITFYPDGKFIEADSVLAGYMSTRENTKHNGIGCSYLLAIRHAKKELNHLAKILEDSLNKEDVEQFVVSQEHWNQYFTTEYDWLNLTYVAYANVSKYGLGREQNLNSHFFAYQTIRNRILRLRIYIDELNLTHKYH